MQLVVFSTIGLLFTTRAALSPASSARKCTTRSHSVSVSMISVDDEAEPLKSFELTGYKAEISFDGFGVEGMTFQASFEDDSKVVYGGGLQSREPGFWRVVKYEDGREFMEATMPLTGEYMFLFDLWESSILWRGQLDIIKNMIVDGEVITNKKRFGLFGYTETIATFKGKLLTPDMEFSKVEVPSLREQTWVPPNDFISPLDMDRFPKIFDKTFMQWFYSVEDALAAGLDPPKRPRAFFAIGKTDEPAKQIRSGKDELGRGLKKISNKKKTGF